MTLTILLPWMAVAAEPFAFALSPAEPGPAYVDCGFLSPEPAGASGPVTVRDGHFVDGAGRRIRFLGTNLTFSGALPTHEQADVVAARLRRFGFNLVRFHHIDGQTAPRGLWADREQTGFDPEMLDRLDYLIAQLERQGVYINLNLHVSRSYPGIDYQAIPYQFRYGKVIDHYHPRLIQLQKDYATALLTHVNPYTQRSYAADPGVAIIELNNENTLLGQGFSPDLLALPDDLLAPLVDGWRAWLAQRYGAVEKAVEAWREGLEPLGDELLVNGDFSAGTTRWTLEVPPPAQGKMTVLDAAGPGGQPALRAELTALGTQPWHFQVHQIGLDLAEGATYTLEFDIRADPPRTLTVGARVDQPDWHSLGLDARIAADTQWRHHRLVFQANRVVPNHSRISFTPGNSLGAIELARVSLRRGVPDDSLANGLTKPPVQGALGRQREDWVAYLIDVERRYVAELRRHLRETIGARAAIISTQASYGDVGGVLREGALSDFVDMHAYWQHPQFPNRPWDPVDWRIANTPMVASESGGTLRGLAQHRVAGLPFSVSEYDHPFPSFYSAEMFPLFAGYAALQDWDAILQFNYASNSANYEQNKVGGYFEMAAHPAKMAFAPIAAVMFRAAGVPTAAEESVLEVPREAVPRLIAKGSGRLAVLWAAAGGEAGLFLQRRLAVRLVDGDGEPRLIGSAGEPPRDGWLAGPEGPFAWRPAPAEEAVARIVGHSAAAVVGRIGGRTVTAGPLSVTLEPTERNFAAVGLAALDTQPLNASRKLLLVIAGAVANRNLGWNADFTSIGRNWGEGPTELEPLTATVRVASDVAGLVVAPLDEHGNPREPLPATFADGAVSFRVEPTQQTIWYAIFAE